MRKERAGEWRARKRSLAGLKPGTMWFKICTVNPEATKAPVLFFMRPFLPGNCPPLLRQAFCYRFVVSKPKFIYYAVATSTPNYTTK